MPAPNETPAEVYDLVVRCVVAYERDGEPALERELAEAGPLAEAVRAHFDAMLRSGLLQAPEQPESIGPYRVLQRLGSGGMGAVFLCEQHEPVRRRVAVKVLRSGMDSREILARFALERQTLALLDHPGIAKVLDAGTTSTGRPFLVMEYVPGLPLLRYCDDRQLNARARLQLFARVCDAVQHAHHKGIVHRDLKPGNVLVVDRDGQASPVVIDFGVAKSVGGAMTGATLLTLPGAMLGTPEYMSPEQATHEQDVDTRTDVYSLGVVLYELLTGTLPIERDQFRGGDVARVVGSVEPPTPSTRITTLGACAAAIAERRRTDVSALRRLLRGDLDWIALKALEKDRNRRYGTPAELAADVRRHLASEPVSAGPPSAWYRFQKLCARNRLQATAAALVLGAVGVGLGTSLWFWRDAAASSRSSQQSLDDALAAVGELVQVGDSDLVDVPHLASVRQSLLERSVGFYERFVARAADVGPSLQPRIADAQLRLGCMQAQLGHREAAIATLRHGLARADGLPPRDVLLGTRVRGMHALADALERGGDERAAQSLLQQAEGSLRPALDAAPADADLRALLLHTLRLQGRLLARSSGEQALAVFAEAVRLGEPFADPAAPRARLALAVQVGSEHARQMLDLGRRDEGLQELRRVKALWERARGGEVDDAVDWRLTTAAGELAKLFALCDDYDLVLGMLAAAEATYERLVRDHGDVLAYRVGLASTRSAKAVAELRSWKMKEGVATVTQAEADHAAALQLAPQDLSMLHDAAMASVAVAQAHLEARRQNSPFDLDLARAARSRAEQRLAELAALPGGSKVARRPRIEVLRLVAVLAEPPGSPAALAALREALGLADELLAEDPAAVMLRERRIELRSVLGRSLRAGGDAKAAREVLRPALAEQAGLRATAPSSHLWVQRRRELLLELARAEAALGQVEAVLPLLQEFLDLAINEDWIGRNQVARLCIEFAEGPFAGSPAARTLFARGREVVQLALAAGRAFEEREKTTSPAMLASMRAGTHAILADLEAKAGDLPARAAALGSVAACYAEVFAAAKDERAEARLRKACEPWVEALRGCSDDAGAAAACERMGQWFAGRPDGLAFVARCAARHLAMRTDAAVVRQAGQRALAAAIEAGFDRQAVAEDAQLLLLGQ